MKTSNFSKIRCHNLNIHPISNNPESIHRFLQQFSSIRWASKLPFWIVCSCSHDAINKGSCWQTPDFRCLNSSFVLILIKINKYIKHNVTEITLIQLLNILYSLIVLILIEDCKLMQVITISKESKLNIIISIPYSKYCIQKGACIVICKKGVFFSLFLNPNLKL